MTTRKFSFDEFNRLVHRLLKKDLMSLVLDFEHDTNGVLVHFDVEKLKELKTIAS